MTSADPLPPPSSRLPRILGGIAFAAVLIVLGAIGFAVVMLKSGPEAQGSDPAAKIFVASLVLAAAALAGWTVKALTALVLRLFRGR